MTARFFGVGVVSLTAATLVLAGCPSDDGGSDDTTTTMTSGMTDTGMQDTGTGPSTDISFADDLQPIIDSTCVPACHEPGGNWPTFDMTDSDLYDRLIDMPSPTQGMAAGCDLVTPGDSSMSYLYVKLAGTHVGAPCNGTGLQMPATTDLSASDPLPADQIQMFADWIDGGAPP